MSRIVYGRSRFAGSVLDECLVGASAQRQDELRVMLQQKAAELEEIRQAKKARWAERNEQRKRDKALARERKWKFQEGR